ncbi:hypothetical protein SODG_003291 [Sodalis praecaptivus]
MTRLAVITQAIKVAFIHKQEEFFLVFSGQAVNFVEKEKASVCFIQQTGFLFLRAGKGPLHITE